WSATSVKSPLGDLPSENQAFSVMLSQGRNRTVVMFVHKSENGSMFPNPCHGFNTHLFSFGVPKYSLNLFQ
ncbi:MAG: hypothetical protein ABFS56_35660, partial [Pseudomonadota bacterium]